MLRQALEPQDYPFFDYRRFTFSLGIAAGDSIFLSGSTAVKFDSAQGAMVVSGDLLNQARIIYQKMDATLKAAKRGLGDVVRMTRYVTPAALVDMPRLDDLQASMCPHHPPVTTVIVKQLLRQEALIEIEGVAGAMPPTASIYSCEGDPAEGDIVGQCRALYHRLGAMLEQDGHNLDAVVKTTEFITPPALAAYRKTAEIRREIFALPYPAATGVIRSTLPRPGAQISLEAIAVTRT